MAAAGYHALQDAAPICHSWPARTGRPASHSARQQQAVGSWNPRSVHHVVRCAGGTRRMCRTSRGPRTTPRWCRRPWRTPASSGMWGPARAGSGWRTMCTSCRGWPGTPVGCPWCPSAAIARGGEAPLSPWPCPGVCTGSAWCRCLSLPACSGVPVSCAGPRPGSVKQSQYQVPGAPAFSTEEVAALECLQTHHVKASTAMTAQVAYCGKALGSPVGHSGVNELMQEAKGRACGLQGEPRVCGCCRVYGPKSASSTSMGQPAIAWAPWATCHHVLSKIALNPAAGALDRSCACRPD